LEGGGFQIRGGNKLKIILNNCSQEASGDIEMIEAQLTVKYGGD
jgi:hypothetical protein